MKEDEVPQDGEQYNGHRRLLYATNAQGDFVGVQSSGWEPETIATGGALAELERQQRDAWQRAQRGETSALEYYMLLRRMDVALLSQATGLFRWRIRRHFRPAVYARLNARLLARYSEALGIAVPVLRTLVEQPPVERS